MPRFALLGGLVLVLSFPLTAADEKKDVPKELAPFQGTWKLVKVEADGKPLPEKDFAEGRFTFEGTKLSVLEDAKQKPDGGTFVVDTAKDPHTIDFVTSAGNKGLGIYKFEKDGKLTLCFVKGRGAARPKAFGEAGSVLVVLEKVKK
jgi:uncharacterized protein (TIGR03067 family)